MYASDQSNNTFTSEAARPYGRHWLIAGNLYFITNHTLYSLARRVQVQYSKNEIQVSLTQFTVIPLTFSSYFKRQGTQIQIHINLPRELQIKNLNIASKCVKWFLRLRRASGQTRKCDHCFIRIEEQDRRKMLK